MSFPRYEEYRDSGVDWLGDVPAHWVNDPLCGSPANAATESAYRSIQSNVR